ncbi:MAG: phosphatidylglycerol lysyltransferase domain-containing protein [Candidatus Wallbacteria bacterium]
MNHKIREILKKYDFKPITLDEKENIDSYFTKEKCNFSDYCFSLAFIWSTQNSVMIKKLHDNDTGKDSLIIIKYLRGQIDMLYPPIGCLTEKHFINAINWSVSFLSEIYEQLKIKNGNAAVRPRILSISGTRIEMINKARMPLEISEDLYDYIYERNELIQLSGSKYKNKRENINKFLKTYRDYEIELINDKNISEILKFLKTWYAENKPSETVSISNLLDNTFASAAKNFIWESYQTRKYLRNYFKLGGIGICIKIYGTIAGFIIGEQVTENTFSVLIEKVNNDLFGLSQFLFIEYVKNYTRCQFINTADDADSAGLKVLKESYGPVELKKRYFVTIDK